tara:strand:+ start:2791 stop:4023 length:1233 start_codon:yes stop_codon:yes gene_type:complete
MTIKTGDIADADTVLNNLLGLQFKNYAQNIWNADYIGWNAKLNYDKEAGSGGTPDFTNLHWDNFNGNGIGVDEYFSLELDSTNKVYYTPDFSNVNNYVVIEATSFGSWTNGTNDTNVMLIGSGKWLVYCTSGNDEVQRAQIYKSLFSTDVPTSGQLILDFNTITAVKTASSIDIGKQAHYATSLKNSGGPAGTYTGTFADTTTNTDCNSWSVVSTGAGGNSASWELGGVGKNTVSGNNQNSNELGTDTSGDDESNPATGIITTTGDSGSVASGSALILCKGDITWATANSPTASNVDYNTDYSIPNMTSAGTLSEEGALTAYLTSNSISASVTNGLAVWNSAIDSANTETFYISADNGSNYESATEKEIKRLSNSGSNLKIKWEIVRADVSKKDSISAYALIYNVGAGSA